MLEKSLAEMEEDRQHINEQRKNACVQLERLKSANKDLTNSNQLLQIGLDNLTRQVEILEEEKVQFVFEFILIIDFSNFVLLIVVRFY